METPYPVELAADVVGGEQSSGTFVKVPGETADLKERFRARIEEIKPLEDVSTPSLPGAAVPKDGTFHRAEVTLSFSIENMGTNLPTLIATVAGNLFELRDVSGLKLLDIAFPDVFKDAYPGPQFGIAGTRELAGVYDRPIIGTIVKPSVGLTPESTASLVEDLADADIDFVKDDELIANPPYSPIKDRVSVVTEVQ